jgi:ribosomal-protein-alanine N-acetyltransferase
MVSISISTPDMAADIATLQNQCFPNARWTDSEIRKLLGESMSLSLVAINGEGDMEGYILSRLVGDEGEIVSIGVRVETRGYGVGRCLVQAVLAEAKMRGARTIFLEVAQKNMAALRLYRGFEFSEVAIRERYYRLSDDTYDDAIVLRNTLI